MSACWGWSGLAGPPGSRSGKGGVEAFLKQVLRTLVALRTPWRARCVGRPGSHESLSVLEMAPVCLPRGVFSSVPVQEGAAEAIC